MGWLIFLAYFVGFIFSVKFFARKTLEYQERNYPSLLDSEQDYREATVESTMMAVFPSLVWPVAFVGYYLYQLFISKAGVIETDRYRRLKAERELAEVRRVARQHNLPMP